MAILISPEQFKIKVDRVKKQIEEILKKEGLEIVPRIHSTEQGIFPIISLESQEAQQNSILQKK